MTDNLPNDEGFEKVVCPLCESLDVEFYHRDKKRDYYQCENCRLVLVPKPFWLSSEEEKNIYDLHENSFEDEGYRKFLSRLVDPLLEAFGTESSEGLEFGCGKAPVLAEMLEKQGHTVKLYDPFYFNVPENLKKEYDFITATEVVEHFQEPGEEFEKLFSMLKRGGYLGIMTKLVLSKEAFSNWHYIRDETHISFFSRATLEYIEAKYSASLTIIGNDVAIFKRKQY